jgi:hypothetical protein
MKSVTIKKAGIALGLGLVALLGVAREAEAQDEKSWGLDVGIERSSKYLFRGLDLLAGEPVDWGHAYFSTHGFAAYWYGYKGDIGDNGPNYFENDFGLDYTFGSDAAYMTVGAVTYTYADPEDFEDTTEIYAIAGLPGVLFSPTFSLYYDVDLYDGAYASLAFSHSADLGGGFSLTPSAAYGYSLGWTEKAFGFDEARNPNDILLGLNLAYAVGNLGLHAQAQKSIAMSALDTVGQGDLTVFTVGASYSF